MARARGPREKRFYSIRYRQIIRQRGRFFFLLMGDSGAIKLALFDDLKLPVPAAAGYISSRKLHPVWEGGRDEGHVAIYVRARLLYRLKREHRGRLR